jgi:hypothetical protein
VRMVRDLQLVDPHDENVNSRVWPDNSVRAVSRCASG